MVISKKLREHLEFLKENGQEIADAFLKLVDSTAEFHNDIGFLDFATTGPDKISYITFQRSSQFKKEDSEEFDFFDVDKRSRLGVMQNPGKIIVKLFGNGTYHQKMVEQFSLVFVKSNKDILNTEFKQFSIVSGNDLLFAYHENNYYNSNGTLGSSCMRYSRAQDYVKFYARNPKAVRLIVKKNDNGRVEGRALLWNAFKEDGTRIMFMDRIYTNNSQDEQMFKEFAKANGFAFKGQNSYSAKLSVFLPPDYKNPVDLAIFAELEDLTNKYYPYADSMSFVSVTGKLIGNDHHAMCVKHPRDAVYTITSTGGGFSDDSRVKSNIAGRYLMPDEKYYRSEFHKDFIPDDVAVKIKGDYYWINEPTLILDYKGERNLKQHCKESKYHNGFVDSSVAKKVRIGKKIDYVDSTAVKIVYSKYYNIAFLEDDAAQVEIFNEATNSVTLDYAPKNKCVFSKTLDKYIFKEYAVKIEDDYIIGDRLKELIELAAQKRKEIVERLARAKRESLIDYATELFGNDETASKIFGSQDEFLKHASAVSNLLDSYKQK